MAAIRQKLRKHMLTLPRWIEPCDGNRLPPGRRDAPQRAQGRVKKDRAGRIPCTAADRRSVGQSLRRSAGDVDALKLACRREPDRPAIGGPKRIGTSFRSHYRLCLGLVQRAKPEPVRPITRCGENDITSIGRKRKLLWRGRRRRSYIDAHFRRLCRRFL